MSQSLRFFKSSLRSSRFLSFSRRRGDRTSERKAGERRSTPGMSKKVGEKWGGVSKKREGWAGKERKRLRCYAGYLNQN